MAVVALYMSDRDPKTTFISKKDADEWDKTLELAEAITSTLGQHVGGVSEALAEEIGLFLAKNKNTFAAAMKGRTEALFEDALVPANDKPKVVPIKAEA